MIRLFLVTALLAFPMSAFAQDDAKPVERKPNPFFAKLDKNNNGSLSEQEFLDQYKAQFRRMDKDNNGSVTEDEFKSKNNRNRQSVDRSKLKERFKEIRENSQKEERRIRRAKNKGEDSEAEPAAE